MKKRDAILKILTILILIFAGCDIYKGEEKDWPNDVSVYFKNSTNCPLDFYLDGDDKGRVDPAMDLTVENLGQGIHLLEAYSWNDVQHPCDTTFTQPLVNKDTFNWELTSSSQCNVCKPTPTPAPTTTPHPGASPTPTSSPVPTATPFVN